ncbi:MAG: hypothetical protein M1825_003946 [Sarcosagium campestre]|nr:MAG: hypothetical protein M1825_003946 [Sarcosagium campestre]
MSATTRKAPPRTDSLRSSSASQTNSRGTSPSLATPPPQSISRAGSGKGIPAAGIPVSARAAAKRPAGGNPNFAPNRSNSQLSGQSNDGDDSRAEAAALITELKAQLLKAESVSEDYQRQVLVLQSRLDEALGEEARLEDRLHAGEERIAKLEQENKDALRRRNEMESIYEAERASMLREKDDMEHQEEELHTIIRRLKETLSARGVRTTEEESRAIRSSGGASPGLQETHFAPPSTLQRHDSEDISKLLLQKDRIIESLRLDLAEAQIKQVESENMGGGRLQELEKNLLEARMANARLMEDNEGFQLLLSEKTLNGEFSKADFMQTSTLHAMEDSTSHGDTLGSSLADELESANEADSEKFRKVEAEAKSLKDQNKALTLYINNIIERLLQHTEFEAILDKTPNLMAGPVMPGARHGQGNVDKELPAPPPDEEKPVSLLQRAKSIAGGTGTRQTARPRPMSQMGPPPSSYKPSITDDPATAPSVPLGRSQSVRAGGAHRRTTSEWAPPASASVVNQMYRGAPVGATSPASPGGLARQTSYFMPSARPGNPNAAARVPSGSSEGRPFSSSGNGDHGARHRDSDGEAASPPSAAPAAAAASIVGNKLRPLRLVQENTELGSGHQGGRSMVDEEAELKRAKRGSWIGWFNKGKGEEGAAGPAPGT